MSQTDTTSSELPEQIGTLTIAVFTTALLWYVVAALGIHDAISGNWDLAAVGDQPLETAVVTFAGALIFVPIAVAIQTFVRKAVPDRYRWPVTGVVFYAVATVGYFAHGGFHSTLATSGMLTMLFPVVEYLAVIALLTSVVVGGSALGWRLATRRPARNRRQALVAVLLVSGVLVAPVAVGAVVDDDPEQSSAVQTQWPLVHPDDPEDPTVHYEDRPLADVTCDDAFNAADDMVLSMYDRDYEIADSSTDIDGFTATLTTLDADDNYYYSVDAPADHTVIAVDAQPRSDSRITARTGDDAGDIKIASQETARVWADVITADGEVVQYQFDICPGNSGDADE